MDVPFVLLQCLSVPLTGRQTGPLTAEPVRSSLMKIPLMYIFHLNISSIDICIHGLIGERERPFNTLDNGGDQSVVPVDPSVFRGAVGIGSTGCNLCSFYG